jgi:hypothetical protein
VGLVFLPAFAVALAGACCQFRWQDFQLIGFLRILKPLYQNPQTCRIGCGSKVIPAFFNRKINKKWYT